jgi:hypothetical protein
MQAKIVFDLMPARSKVELEQIADQLHRLFGRGSGIHEMWREIFEQAHTGLVNPHQNHGLLGLQCQRNF